MIDTATDLYTLWSSFEIPAYPEYSVPSEATKPYITYTLPKGDLKSILTHQARLWYDDTSLTDISSKTDEITQKIGTGLAMKTFVISPGSPLAQLQPSEDIKEKIMYMNFTLSF